MIGLVLLLAAGLLIAWLIVTALTMHRLRNPPRRTYAWAVARGLPGDPREMTPAWTSRSFTVTWRGLSLECWDIDGHDPDGPVVIATPGWGDSKLGVLPRLEALASDASRVMAWDPPGHAESPGRCLLGTREHEIIRLMIEEAIPEAERGRGVVLYGWSLGAGASIHAAIDHPDVRAVIAEAPYRLPWTPAIRVLHLAGYPYRVNVPPAFALLGARLGVGVGWSGFDRAELAGRLTCPLLVIHGTADEVCPVSDGHEIARAAVEGLCIEIEQATHNTIWTEDQFREQAAGAVRAVTTTARASRGAEETSANSASNME